MTWPIDAQGNEIRGLVEALGNVLADLERPPGHGEAPSPSADRSAGRNGQRAYGPRGGSQVGAARASASSAGLPSQGRPAPTDDDRSRPIDTRHSRPTR